MSEALHMYIDKYTKHSMGNSI